ncbi:MAG: hypothetical protein Q9177_004331, partial [Variospora cf. flavescens]
VLLREKLFNAAWKPQQKIIDVSARPSSLITVINPIVRGYAATPPSTPSTTLLTLSMDRVQLGSLKVHRAQESGIPSGLVTTGPSGSVFASIVASVTSQFKLERKISAVNIVPSQVSNLKAALKLINDRATDSGLDAEDDQHKHEKVLLLWIDRIPFILLFGIKTSIELFQEKLPRRSIRCLRGVQFDVTEISVDVVFRAVSFNKTRPFLLGPGVSSLILQAQQESIQGIASFAKSLQYAYMTHYFANPLSVLLREDLEPSEEFQVEICGCLRNLDSFKRVRLAEDMINRNDAKTVKRLLNDDKFLQDTVIKGIGKGKEALDCVLTAIDLLLLVHSCLDFKPSESWTKLYIKAMAGELRDSPVIKETLLAIQKLPSDSLASLLNRVSDSLVPDMQRYADDLRKLESQKDDATPLRSEYNTHHQSLRTTIVAQKVELSTHVSSLSEQDRSYSRLVNHVDDSLKEYFQNALVTPQELFLHEVLIYDFKSPHREVFAPKPRHATERALSSPHHYLGCNCCKGSQHGLSSTHPATSVLYQLYLESGALINIADLWSAFYTIVGNDDAEDEDDEQERVLALFSRALAELKYLGMIKHSRKKADHLAKLLWNGL